VSNKSLRNLDLNLMVVFEAIYTSGNISQAADKLALSQPAVSNSLARLRQILNDPLFERARNGVEPTAKAKSMIGPVRDALNLIGAQVYPGEPDLSTYKRHFRVMISDVLEGVMMAPVIRALRTKMPLVTLEAVQVNATGFVDDLMEGDVDLACYVFPKSSPDLVTQPIAAIDPVLIARRDHPAFKNGALTGEQYLKLDHIMAPPELRAGVHVEQNMAARGALRRPTYTVSRLWSVPPLVEETDLVGILPRWFVRKIEQNFGIEAHEFPIPIADQHLYMTWHVRNADDAGHTWLREALMSAFRSATESLEPDVGE
jgi:DNA-binding transcriptional LysR family regulator